MTDLGRLVDSLDYVVSAAESSGVKVVSMHRKEARALLSAARELEALKEAMEEMRGWNPNETVCEEIKVNAAAILAEKEKKR